MTPVGIHDIELATTHYALDLSDLAIDLGVDPGKYLVGLGQQRMSVPAPDEDTVTMAAEAGAAIVARHGTDRLRAVIVATESGVDQSKSAAVFVHKLLGLPPHVRAVELKQACYAGSAALVSALGMIAREPGSQVLVVASDVAKYEQRSPGEPTQGAGAVAMLISQDPALLEIEPAAGVSTLDIDDFWRPNDSSTAVVDGSLSMSAYLNALTGAWDDYRSRGGAGIEEIGRLLYHQPFSRMAVKAHRKLAQHTGGDLTPEQLEHGLHYNRELGNSYTASLYIALASLLHHEADLTGTRVGLFSYGSGSVGEFFSGLVREGYRDRLHPEAAAAQIADRAPITVADYRALHAAELGSAVDSRTARVTTAPFRFAGIIDRARRYEATSPSDPRT